MEQEESIVSDKPKLGRPPEQDPKDAIVKLRVDLSEKGHWVRSARKAGKSLSKWLRDLANQHS